MRALALSLVLSSFVLAVVGCSGTEAQTEPTDGGVHEQPDGSTNTGDSGDLGTQCTKTSDCSPSADASCARTCADGSNPCVDACSSVGTCVMRGCAEDNAPSGCVPACSGDTICVKKQFNGGAALMVDDAGACPPGRHAQGGFCAADPSYDCEARPASCGTPFDCSCTSPICTGGYQCEGTTQNEIDCVLNAP